MIFFKEEVLLSEAHLTEVVERAVDSYRNTLKKKAGDTTKLRLQLEEILLRFSKNGKEDSPCIIEGRRLLTRTTFRIVQNGYPVDILEIDEEYQASYDILARLGDYPKYEYDGRNGGKNRVSFRIEDKPSAGNTMAYILVALVLAIACFYLAHLLPPEIEAEFSASFVAPVFSKLIYILSEVATIFVSLAVISGIIGIGDISTFGRIGKKFCLGLGGTYLYAAILLIITGLVFFGIVSGTGESNGSFFGQLMQLVLDIIPNNIIAAFADGNDLQVIVISVFFGSVFLVMGDRIEGFKKVVLDAADFMNSAMLIVLKLIPVVVFFGVLNMLYSFDISSLTDVYLFAVAFLSGGFGLLVVNYTRVYLATKATPAVIIPKQLATLAINIATASQVGALSENMKCCKKKFGIEESFTDFALPLGIVVFMPTGAIFFGLLTWSMSVLGGVGVSIGTMVSIVFVAIIIAIAAPPIPGAALAVLPIVFASSTAPIAMLPVAMILCTILGYFLPAFNGMQIQLQMILTANKLKKIDLDTLRAPYVEEE